MYEGEMNNLNGPSILVFDENYSPDWELSITGQPSAKFFHFTANYYANGWYIDGLSGKYKFNIYYRPQRLLKIGYLLSGVIILISVGYFIFSSRNKNG